MRRAALFLSDYLIFGKRNLVKGEAVLRCDCTLDKDPLFKYAASDKGKRRQKRNVLLYTLILTIYFSYIFPTPEHNLMEYMTTQKWSDSMTSISLNSATEKHYIV